MNTNVAIPTYTDYSTYVDDSTDTDFPTFRKQSLTTEKQSYSTNNTITNFNTLAYTLRTYRDFENNWDGYDGIAAKNETVENALSFLKLLPTHAALPYSGLTGDGEIDLIWDKDNVFIDVSLSGDDTYSFYARNSQGSEHFGDHIPLSNILNSELTNIIKSIKL